MESGDGSLRDVNEFRAAVAHTLGLSGPTEPGPQGLRILNLPTDREMLDEIQRLRELADPTTPQPPR